MMSSPRGMATLDVDAPTTKRPPWRRQLESLQPLGVVETLLIVAALVAHLVLLPHDIYADGLRRYKELDDLLGRGVIPNDKYSIIGPLFAAPLWYLGHLIRSPDWLVARYNLLLFSLGLLAIYLILKDAVDRALIRKFLLILAVASMFPPALSSFYGETFTALGIGIGILAAVFGPTVLGWVAVALGVANTPATAVGMGFATLLRVLQTGRIRYLAAIAGVGGLIVLENLLRHHSVTNSYYEPGFTYPVFFGILSIVFSLGKGLIFFAPAIFLPVRSYLLASGKSGAQLYRAYSMWIAVLVGMVLIYGGWYDWSGDWFWGPRFFLFASLPCSLALAARLHRPASKLPGNLATLALLILCSWLGINGAVFDLSALLTPCIQAHSGCAYLPETSTLWFPFISFHLLPGMQTVKSLIYVGFAALVFFYLALPLLLIIWRQSLVALAMTLDTFRTGRERVDTRW